MGKGRFELPASRILQPVAYKPIEPASSAEYSDLTELLAQIGPRRIELRFHGNFEQHIGRFTEAMCPFPLDDEPIIVPGGLEPPSLDPKSSILPLNDGTLTI